MGASFGRRFCLSSRLSMRGIEEDFMTDSDPLHVVVAGGAGALGEAVVDAFVGEGRVCHVPLRRGAAPPARDGVVWAPGVDLTDEAAVSAFYSALPPISASIHVAGGFAMKPFMETSRKDLEAMLLVNLATAFLCCREAVKRLRVAGGGAIVNVGSRASEVPSGGAIAYTISKAGVAAMTRRSRRRSGATGSGSTPSSPRRSTRPRTAPRCRMRIRAGGPSRRTSLARSCGSRRRRVA
jgi:NAD(P)-dependent dehydrogenase (short-subunit alcohol dehydrogenase family)